MVHLNDLCNVMFGFSYVPTHIYILDVLSCVYMSNAGMNWLSSTN